MKANFQYEVKNHRYKNIKIITFNGEIDESNQLILDKLMQKNLEDESVEFLVIDLSNFTYINSRGIGLLASAYKNFEEADKKIVLANPNKYIFDVITAVGLDSIIECFNTVEEACLSLE